MQYIVKYTVLKKIKWPDDKATKPCPLAHSQLFDIACCKVGI